jgi:choline dehydrogenase
MIYLPGSQGDWCALARDWNIDPLELRQHLPHQIPTALWPCASEPEIHPLSQRFLDACQEWQQQAACDFLMATDYTSGAFPRSIQHGRRVTAYQAFVATAATAGNVLIESDTLVERILFKDHRAVAVQCVCEGVQRIFTANSGIILCAGAIETPALLLRSGIGGAEYLESLRIPVVHDLPGVGCNLQDHLLMPLITQSQEPSLTHRPSLSDSQNYRWYGRGPLTSNIAEAGCFFQSRLSSANASLHRVQDSRYIPDLQIHFTPTHYLEYPIRPEPTSAFSLGLTLLQPFSRGRILLASSEAKVPPRIDPAYLSDARDLQIFLEGIERCRELAATPPLATISGGEILPGAKRASGLALERAVRAFVQTVFHPVGTCAVGDTPDSVVDNQFRVYGCDGLYIVDGSVFNRIPACNPAAQIMTLASLAAHRIAT